MKLFLGGMLGLTLVFGLAAPLPAEENVFIDIQSSLSFVGNTYMGNTYMNNEYVFLADGTESGNQDFSTGRRIGAGFMNIFLGLGSYTMGDWRGGLGLTIADVITVPLSVLAISIWVRNPEWAAFPRYSKFTTGNMTIDLLLLMPLWYGIWVFFWAMPYIGVASYVVNFVYKFIRPFDYHKPAAKTARLNDLRNWDAGLMPNENGRMNGYLAFTAHF